ncbi:tetratricopeptide repeat protein 16 isoform X4 [Betta splendens]|uniref:Tetratricopeptide repeat protein 16 isoform X4 n=1 Tax=Betta splendens TaxID=158456 RepID=A0A6P7NMC5_BETSP|nr:tetratricopeptide repeat protein 16 isoform X4 [Betta splendens]XP_040928320.1 tetratricopeptide repeat protein 16 isoform X4 [Betta splendens]
MDAREETAEEPSLFPTAVSEEQLEEAKTESTSKPLYVSSQVFPAPGEKRMLQGSLIIQKRASEHYMNGKEAMEKCQYEKAVICFSKGINLQPEQTQLYVSRAEAYLQLCDFQSAAACFKQACVRQPRSFSDRLAFVYYLQGQCLFDRGLFLDALESFTKAAQVKPGCRTSAVRSLACLTAAGHLTDCLQVLNDWIASDEPTSDLYVLRARLHKQMNQNSQCYRDVQSALLLKPSCPEAEALLLQLREAGEGARRAAVGRALTGHLSEALSLINLALGNCPEDGRLYLCRAILYRRLQDFSAAIEDLLQAAELSEAEEAVRRQAEAPDGGAQRGWLQKEAELQLVLTYNDLAVQCFGRGLYAEATVLLNKAVQGEKGLAGLYLNRGDCFFRQREWSFALADYQQAEEMLPGEPAVRLRLGVVHHTLGSLYFEEGRFHDAAVMFSAAVRQNPTASRYYENRSKAFRKVLNWERAQQDLICTLILDPTNEESCSTNSQS